MGLSWSPAIKLLKKELASVPATSGLYKILDAARNKLLYVGETKNLHVRLYKHVSAKWSYLNPLASFHVLAPNILDHQRRELETDLIGAYYEAFREPPSFQYREELVSLIHLNSDKKPKTKKLFHNVCPHLTHVGEII